MPICGGDAERDSDFALGLCALACAREGFLVGCEMRVAQRGDADDGCDGEVARGEGVQLVACGGGGADDENGRGVEDAEGGDGVEASPERTVE